MAQITAWWELNTDAASRLAAPPPRVFRYRRSGLWQAVAALVMVIPLTGTWAQFSDDLGTGDGSYLGYDIAQIVPATLLFLLFAVWSGALVRAWLLDRTVRFRWWVPLVALTMLPTAQVGTQESNTMAPLHLADYVPSMLTLVVALALTALIGVLRERGVQGAVVQASGPSPGDS